MPRHQTILRCSQTTATILFIIIGALFIITGCRGIYQKLGMTPDQVDAQVAADQQTITQILDQSRTSTTQIITSAIAGLGAIASGILAKWLGTERKITDTLITTIESNSNAVLKEMIQAKAKKRGIEPKLAARVKALT